jgi:transposase
MVTSCTRKFHDFSRTGSIIPAAYNMTAKSVMRFAKATDFRKEEFLDVFLERPETTHSSQSVVRAKLMMMAQ